MHDMLPPVPFTLASLLPQRVEKSFPFRVGMALLGLCWAGWFSNSPSLLTCPPKVLAPQHICV